MRMQSGLSWKHHQLQETRQRTGRRCGKGTQVREGGAGWEGEPAEVSPGEIKDAEGRIDGLK